MSGEAWSHSVVANGNRVRVYEHANGIMYIDVRPDGPDGRRLRRSLGHRDREAAIRHAEECVANGKRQFVNPWAKAAAREVVYVVQRGGPDGPIKIGKTRNLRKRLRDLQNTVGEDLTLLATYSIRDLEAHFHERCRRHRLNGEWFSAKALTHLPRSLRDQDALGSGD